MSKDPYNWITVFVISIMAIILVVALIVPAYLEIIDSKKINERVNSYNSFVGICRDPSKLYQWKAGEVIMGRVWRVYGTSI